MTYDPKIKGLNNYMKFRPVLSPEELELVNSGRSDVIEEVEKRIRVLKRLEEGSIGRMHAKINAVIAKKWEIINRYDPQTDSIVVDKREVIEFYHDILETPPEFKGAELWKDPEMRKKVEKYLKLKDAIRYYAVPILLYIFENVLKAGVYTIFTRDLVAGEPAHMQEDVIGGQGRDIDYFVVIESEEELEEIRKFAKERVEPYLNNFVGSAITNYLWKEAAGIKTDIGKKYLQPYNEAIEHDIVEIHVIAKNELKNMFYLSKEPREGYSLLSDINGGVYAKPVEGAEDVKFFDMGKYRERVKRIVREMGERFEMEEAVYESMIKKAKFKIC